MRIRDLYWAAGVLEGEGWFGLSSQNKQGYRYPRIAVGMTDYDTIERVGLVFRVGNVIGPHRPSPTGKERWMWQVTTTPDAVSVMYTLWPLMGARRRTRIEEVIQLWR